MIYLFYGENQDKARAKWRKVIDNFHTKYPSGVVFNFSSENFNFEKMEELIAGQSLFAGGEGKRLVVADHLLENKEALEFFETSLKSLIESNTVFAFLETKVPIALERKIEKFGGKVEMFNKTEEKNNYNQFNLFALCDALGERDRKRLWVLSQEAIFFGIPAEEVFWKLVWQVKMMLLVLKSRGRELKTVKPFVASKASRYARNYSEVELEKLSGDLVALWHEAKRENAPDFELGLERLILNI